MNRQKFSESIESQIEFLNRNLGKEKIDSFQKLLLNCELDKNVNLLLVSYLHLLPSALSAQVLSSKGYQQIQRPIKIGYLVNQDIVFYDKLDDILCNYLKYEGAEVLKFKLEDIFVKASNGGIDIWIHGEKCDLDGFLSYGYRKKLNMDAYYSIVKIMQEKGVTCLHSHKMEQILNSKLMQAIHFAKSNIAIPDTYQSFEIKSTKQLVDKLDVLPCLVKPHNDYCGDNIIKLDHKVGVINAIGKSLWNGEHLLIQKFIPDYYGKSLRVLCFNGKCYGIIGYEDITGDYRSSVGFGDACIWYSCMNHPKYETFKQVAEQAVKALGEDVLVAGVDLLDSEQEGVVVLEINGWPDLFDIWFVAKKCAYNKFILKFLEKIKRNLELKKVHL
ncbi:probable alpha-L-glutamate ligase [Hydra vulgaris]|uniref:Probable alpha-L-glutamate ligase n=1 Tax=Hydra vulgaris TaxID=6087 RepID=A0ABM4BU32_HYDVU